MGLTYWDNRIVDSPHWISSHTAHAASYRHLHTHSYGDPQPRGCDNIDQHSDSSLTRESRIHRSVEVYQSTFTDSQHGCVRSYNRVVISNICWENSFLMEIRWISYTAAHRQYSSLRIITRLRTIDAELITVEQIFDSKHQTIPPHTFRSNPAHAPTGWLPNSLTGRLSEVAVTLEVYGSSRRKPTL